MLLHLFQLFLQEETRRSCNDAKLSTFVMLHAFSVFVILSTEFIGSDDDSEYDSTDDVTDGVAFEIVGAVLHAVVIIVFSTDIVLVVENVRVFHMYDAFYGVSQPFEKNRSIFLLAVLR